VPIQYIPQPRKSKKDRNLLFQKEIMSKLQLYVNADDRCMPYDVIDASEYLYCSGATIDSVEREYSMVVKKMPKLGIKVPNGLGIRCYNPSVLRMRPYPPSMTFFVKKHSFK
jgi:hypothetical protein